ncbi:hypothetical protein DEO72_LG7g828 [Vigna unguiculata]|uniref:Uncharacterized protein n=1 Tax=Vigna unguiculata TaxID=3917 RepID=A0A4D6MII4_VIGUN|nr:hypothetical protein DEO72_LG7g827 [Vigna unguiculata]QCD99545.1 hypothetical protein DEO72_LG7g828 [Vigna unguiculata]
MKGLGRSPNGKAAERWLEGNHNGVKPPGGLYIAARRLIHFCTNYYISGFSAWRMGGDRQTTRVRLSFGVFLRVWCELFGGKARRIHWVVKRTGLGKRGLGGVADAIILGNYQNFMNRLAARDLPPGAVTEPWMCVYVCRKFGVLGFVEKAGVLLYV